VVKHRSTGTRPVVARGKGRRRVVVKHRSTELVPVR